MTAGDIVLIIGAAGTAITAIIAALTRRDVKTVHSLVNQAATDAKAYNLLLSDTLRKHDIIVPVDESVVPPDK